MSTWHTMKIIHSAGKSFERALWFRKMLTSAYGLAQNLQEALRFGKCIYTGLVKYVKYHGIALKTHRCLCDMTDFISRSI